MKKYIIVMTFVAIAMSCFGQNIIQVNSEQGNSNSQKEDCAFRINGICSTEDIGGVMTEFKIGNLTGEDNHVYLHAENYNNSTVTVLLQFYYSREAEHDLLNFVLKPFEKKAIMLSGWYTSYYQLEGIIVRKLQ